MNSSLNILKSVFCELSSGVGHPVAGNAKDKKLSLMTCLRTYGIHQKNLRGIDGPCHAASLDIFQYMLASG